MLHQSEILKRVFLGDSVSQVQRTDSRQISSFVKLPESAKNVAYAVLQFSVRLQYCISPYISNKKARHTPRSFSLLFQYSRQEYFNADTEQDNAAQYFRLV